MTLGDQPSRTAGGDFAVQRLTNQDNGAKRKELKLCPLPETNPYAGQVDRELAKRGTRYFHNQNFYRKPGNNYYSSFETSVPSSRYKTEEYSYLGNDNARLQARDEELCHFSCDNKSWYEVCAEAESERYGETLDSIYDRLVEVRGPKLGRKRLDSTDEKDDFSGIANRFEEDIYGVSLERFLERLATDRSHYGTENSGFSHWYTRPERHDRVREYARRVQLTKDTSSEFIDSSLPYKPIMILKRKYEKTTQV